MMWNKNHTKRLLSWCVVSQALCGVLAAFLIVLPHNPLLYGNHQRMGKRSEAIPECINEKLGSVSMDHLGVPFLGLLLPSVVIHSLRWHQYFITSILRGYLGYFSFNTSIRLDRTGLVAPITRRDLPLGGQSTIVILHHSRRDQFCG